MIGRLLSTRRPRVGVTGSRGRGRIAWAFHWAALTSCGLRPRRLTAPLAELEQREDLDALDGLVIGGGDDIGAEIYAGAPTPDVRLDPERDALELALMDRVLARGIPVLGVCRGAQMLAVSQGGALHQDIYAVYTQAPRLKTPLPRKRVRLEDGSRIAQVIGRRTLWVNSLHHQSIAVPGRGQVISGRDTWGVAQAVEDPDPDTPFRIGVQWHPEYLFFFHTPHRRLIRAFAKAVLARGRAADPVGDPAETAASGYTALR